MILGSHNSEPGAGVLYQVLGKEEQVDRLADKLEAYSKDKEELLREIGELRAELAAAHQTIKYLEEFLRRK